MKASNENTPDPKELEKEIGEFLAKKFGGEVKIVSPETFPQEMIVGKEVPEKEKKTIKFDLKPEELISYLDEYIVQQDEAKAILATKICTHYNRIKRSQEAEESFDMVGQIKNNVLMIGPTGVGKTYMVKLIAKKIGVPFVKGDATKFSETGYVGGDVEDLVRDLVREADDDIDLAQCGIIYIDEIDKIASSRNLVGSDISRTGVQRALLKPMEETEVELKVPHDPISMIQEIERFRKTGTRDKRSVNTKNILFIMSGAFADLTQIVKKRITKGNIGFGAQITNPDEDTDIQKQVKSEDLISFGFESEFVGRLPVHSVLARLTREDLYDILKNPNNPVVLGKKLDFAAYGIDIKFEDEVLMDIAKSAHSENTGARGLVSAIEQVLLPFEKSLPSTSVNILPVTKSVLKDPMKSLDEMKSGKETEKYREMFEDIKARETYFIREHIKARKKSLAGKYNLTLTPPQIDLIVTFYQKQVMDIGSAIKRIKYYSDEIKRIELDFYKKHDINIVLEDDAVDFIIDQFIKTPVDLESLKKQLTMDFEMGLKLVRDKTGKTRFFITRDALKGPEHFISGLLKNDYDPTEIIKKEKPE